MDVEAKKFLGDLWAENGDRRTPEEANITRARGWDINYELPGTGKYPERDVFNQLVRELQGAFQEHMLYGIPRWDAGVNYATNAFVQLNGVIYVATQAITAPGDEPGTSSVWRRY